ncbi:MAG: 30S ribosomal protein S6 [Candidatus Omnitrophota bacterium]
MKKYEGLFILKPNLNEEELGKLFSSILDVVTKNGGAVENKEDMGLRTLAYELKKEKQGRYFLVNFTAAADSVSLIERAYKLNELILRSLIFSQNKK